MPSNTNISWRPITKTNSFIALPNVLTGTNPFTPPEHTHATLEVLIGVRVAYKIFYRAQPFFKPHTTTTLNMLQRYERR